MYTLDSLHPEALSNPQRIAIVGSGGAGKTTLARAIGEVLSLPVVHLDRLFWLPNWEQIPAEEWREAHEQALAGESWVSDGNYNSMMAERFQRADLILFLDVHPATCLWRILKRRIRYHNQTRPEMAEGCTERLDWEFARWIWNYRKSHYQRTLDHISASGNEDRALVLRTNREVRQLLDLLKTPHASR